MRSRALPFLFVFLAATTLRAQMTWQPTAPPLVTAETSSWFQSGEPITWEGDFYYQAGAQQGFNPYQMVRSGSFRGIPLYTDTTLEPYSIVFVPLAGGRVQPYERRRTGALAGTTGSRAPSLPTAIGAERAVPSEGPQAPAPPTYAPAYESTRMTGVAEPEPAGTTGRTFAPAPVATSGRVDTTPAHPLSTAMPPSGANAIWIEFDGQRWYGAGKSIVYDAAQLNEIGTYRGFTVYALKLDAAKRTIYVTSIPGRLSAYQRR